MDTRARAWSLGWGHYLLAHEKYHAEYDLCRCVGGAEDNPDYDWQYNKKPVFKNGELVELQEFKHEGQVWNHSANEKRFREDAEQWGERIQIIKGRSLDVLDKIPDGSMDFIFHDSDHSYPFVMNEIKAYWPKLKRGGYAIGDDHNWTPVCKSVEEVFGTDYKVTGKGVWYAIKD